MNETLREILWQQFGGSLDMLENAMIACSEELWSNGSKEFDFWYSAYHTLFFLDYDMSESPADFHPPAPFTLQELDPTGVLPERVYSKLELLKYLEFGREKCRVLIEGLTDEKAKQRFNSEFRNYSVLENLFQSMRHVQHHAAQLNKLLRQHQDSAPNWVGRTKHPLHKLNQHFSRLSMNPSPNSVSSQNDLILETHQPFSFALTASVLARLPQHNQVERFDGVAGIHQRAIQTSTGARVITAKSHAKGLEIDDDSPEAREWAITSFGLELDPAPFYKVARKDSALSSAVNSLAGLRPPLMTPWEAWVAAILGQQITLSFCLQQISMVSKRFGGEVAGQLADGSSHLFPLHPTPEQILAADETGLLECKISRRKTEYLKTVAKATLDGYFDGVLDGDVTDVLEHLTALRGVGLWTARYWLATTGRLDFLAYGDAGLNAAYKTAYGSLDGIEAWGEALGATRGWAYYYLIWHTKYMK